MKWAKSIRYQASVQIDGKIENILCVQELDDDFSVYSNGDFIANVDNLPEREELVNLISEYKVLEGARA